MHVEVELEKAMTHQKPDGTGSDDASRTHEPDETPKPSAISSVPANQVTASRYSPWVSLVPVLAVAAIAVGLLATLGLQPRIPAVLLGVVGGLVLYELIRRMMVHSAWLLMRTPAARRVAEAVGFRPRPVESAERSTPRSGP